MFTRAIITYLPSAREIKLIYSLVSLLLLADLEHKGAIEGRDKTAEPVNATISSMRHQFPEVNE